MNVCMPDSNGRLARALPTSLAVANVTVEAVLGGHELIEASAFFLSAFIDGVVHVSCDAVVSLTQASFVHETAYTCASSGSYVACASQGIEITNTPTGYPVSFGMPPSVLNATMDRTARAARAAEVTSGDVVTYTCE